MISFTNETKNESISEFCHSLPKQTVI